MSNPLRITVKPSKLTHIGMFYDVLFEGKELCRSRVPLCSAARALRVLGYPDSTLIEMWHETGGAWALRAKLGVAAGLTVVEGDRIGPVFVPWSPGPRERERNPAAPSSDPGAVLEDTREAGAPKA